MEWKIKDLKKKLKKKINWEYYQKKYIKIQQFILNC